MNIRIWVGAILGGIVIWLVIANVLTLINIVMPGWLVIFPIAGLGYWLKGKTWGK